MNNDEIITNYIFNYIKVAFKNDKPAVFLAKKIAKLYNQEYKPVYGMVNKWFNGDRRIPLDHYDEIEKVLNIDISDVVKNISEDYIKKFNSENIDIILNSFINNINIIFPWFGCEELFAERNTIFESIKDFYIHVFSKRKDLFNNEDEFDIEVIFPLFIDILKKLIKLKNKIIEKYDYKNDLYIYCNYFSIRILELHFGQSFPNTLIEYLEKMVNDDFQENEVKEKIDELINSSNDDEYELKRYSFNNSFKIIRSFKNAESYELYEYYAALLNCMTLVKSDYSIPKQLTDGFLKMDILVNMGNKYAKNFDSIFSSLNI